MSWIDIKGYNIKRKASAKFKQVDNYLIWEIQLNQDYNLD